MNRDALWLVEYIPSRKDYRVSRFAEPDKAVAYVDFWSDAVKNIKGYCSAVKIIFIRTSTGNVDYWYYKGAL